MDNQDSVRWDIVTKPSFTTTEEKTPVRADNTSANAPQTQLKGHAPRAGRAGGGTVQKRRIRLSSRSGKSIDFQQPR